MNRPYFPAAPLALAVLFLAAPVLAQQTPEEIRYAAELKACDRQPPEQRGTCRDLVEAKIKADWIARIEDQSRRRQAP